jgi:hypothetical protein
MMLLQLLPHAGDAASAVASLMQVLLLQLLSQADGAAAAAA